MCQICVEIIRERITFKDAKRQMQEARSAGSDVSQHIWEIIEADNDGDVKKVEELIKAGYKKERWL